MLRLLVLALVLANGVYFAWAQGLLRPYGIAPDQQAEPQRVRQQIRPQALRLLDGDEAGRLEAAAGPPHLTECLQAGVFDEPQSAALRAALEGKLPASTWSLESAVDPGRWIVYMGKYPNDEAVTRKKAELRYLHVSFEALGNPALEPGLSLGGFESQAAATYELGELTKRGVRTARVVQERPEQRGQMLRLPSVDEGLRARLDELRSALGGKPLRACPR